MIKNENDEMIIVNDTFEVYKDEMIMKLLWYYYMLMKWFCTFADNFGVE